MGPFVRRWRLAAAAAALCCACERAEPAPTVATELASDAIAPQPDAVALADPTAPGTAGVPPFVPPAPQPDLALPPIPGEAAPASPPPRRSRPPQKSSDIAAAVAAPAVEHPPLDMLLRAPELPPEAKPLELAPAPPPAASRPKPAPGALDRLGQNIRLERRKEPIGLAGPRQGTLFETEAGLRIPVDEAISLEGGVRVDSREEPGVKEPDRRSTPRVGVEVRF
jgi:hypothetical protein